MNYTLIYMLIGLGYWAVNIFIRQLHLVNEDGDGWFLVPLWLFGWPFCFIALLAAWISDKYRKRKL